MLFLLAPIHAAAQTRDIETQLRQLPRREETSQQRQVADRLLLLAEQQVADGSYATAIRAWERALDIYAALGDFATLETTYGQIGLAYAQLGSYDQAEVAVRRQLAASRDNQNFSGQITAWNTLGSLALQRGAVASAVAAYEEALSVAQSVQNYEGMGLALSNLGLVAAAQQDYDTAISYYEAAGNYRIRAGNLAGRANTSNNLGNAYLAQNRLSEAIGAYRLALSYGQDIDDTLTQLQAIDGLIKAYSLRQNWEQVQSYLDERIALTLGQNDRWQWLLTYQRLGDFYRATEQFALAQEQYELALGLARELNRPQLEGLLYNQLLLVESRQR